MEREHGVAGRLLAYGVIDKRVPPLWEARPADFPLATFVLDHATGLIVHSQLRARPGPRRRVRGADLRRSASGLARSGRRAGARRTRRRHRLLRRRQLEQADPGAPPMRSQRLGASSRSSCCSWSGRRRPASTSIAGCSASASTTTGSFATGGWTRRGSGRSWPEAMSS